MKKYIFLEMDSVSLYCEIYSILGALNHRNKLSRLVRWAMTKHAYEAHQLYRNRLADAETRLFHYSMQFPKPYVFASFLYGLNRLIMSTPRFLSKGSAKGYTYRSLTYSSKSHSMWV